MTGSGLPPTTVETQLHLIIFLIIISYGTAVQITIICLTQPTCLTDTKITIQLEIEGITKMAEEGKIDDKIELWGTIQTLDYTVMIHMSSLEVLLSFTLLSPNEQGQK